ncbi:MAG: AAA family ATPase [Candidatus Bathyarchaeota archaeon]|nr:AAA family ATPase [Candidatus Bathyarchaeota archaeon]
MKLRYLKAKNILSFGDEEVEINFGSFNTIAGPNNSGKTNLLRALQLIGNAFDYRNPAWEGIFFKGDKEKPFRLEVGVELDDDELEFLATVIICFEMQQIERRSSDTIGITENKHWKDILLKYGKPILLKTFKRLSFVVRTDQLSIDQPEKEIQFLNQNELFVIERDFRISRINQDLSGGYNNRIFTKLLLESLEEKGKNTEEKIAFLSNKERLFRESPTLSELLKEGMDSSPPDILSFGGITLWECRNSLQTEPSLSKLYSSGKQEEE